MKCSNYHFAISLSLVFIVANLTFGFDKAQKNNTSPRARVNIDANWKFFKGDINNAEQISFDDSNWRSLNLPHDYSIEGPFSKENDRWSGYLPKGIGWYRKQIILNENSANKQIWLEFEGIFRNSTLFVNGKKVGTHPYGYTGVVYNITKFIHCDGKPNCIAVKIDNPKPEDADYTKSQNFVKATFTGGGTRVARFGGTKTDPSTEGWWYEGCGIYRHVWLIATDYLHIAHWGTFITTPHVSESKASVHIKTTVQNDTSKKQTCTVKNTILSPDGQTIASATKDILVPPIKSKDAVQEFTIEKPMLWSLDTPRLYKAKTEIIFNGKTIDSYDTPFGIRWFEFTADRGFFLNGKPLNQLKGMCIHQDCGGLGMALPNRVHEKNVELMKDMGCQLLRLVHHDASPAIMDYCDKMGILLWLETRYLDFPEMDIVKPLRDMIRRSRNHPSIICWGLANTAGSADGRLTRLLQTLNDISHIEDPTRPTAIALEGNTDGNANGFAMVPDLVGYNGGGIRRNNVIKSDQDHENYPDRKIVISESWPHYDARGDYSERKGCLFLERDWAYVAKRLWISAGIMWAGIEYWGEPKGWPIVTSQWGVMDMARFPKDQYYYCLQEWTDEPMVFIFPHWTWPGKKGEVIDVWCYSNCDKVELFLNGKSLGKKPRKPLTHIEWKVPYEPGTITAKGIKNNTVVAEHKNQTAGPPQVIKLEADRTTITADNQDVSFIKISILDSEGVLVPDASNLVEINIQGKGRLLGLCSGNPASHENPKAETMKAFNGLLLAIVQSTQTPNSINITATSEGLKCDTLEIQTE